MSLYSTLRPLPSFTSGALGGIYSGYLFNFSKDPETGRIYSRKERVLKFLSKTLVAAITAVATNALAYYVGFNFACVLIFGGAALFAKSQTETLLNRAINSTTATIFAIFSGTLFGLIQSNS